jgi:hypothetical protein
MNASSATCPTPFELGAAYHVSTVLRATGTNMHVARLSYARISTGGIYRLEHFERAETLLWGCRLIDVVDGVIKPSGELLEIARLPYSEALELLLIATVERQPPVWLYAACEGSELATEAIPDLDWSIITGVIENPDRREAFLLALGRKFDAEEAASTGSEGELFVVEQCRQALTALGHPELAQAVRRVSSVSDQLGYDIVTPTIGNDPWRIEVKTTRSRASVVRTSLTRNEARVGIADQRWILLICFQSDAGHHEILGWCRASLFLSVLPKDVSKDAQWLSARVALDRANLNEGLPSLIDTEAH